MALNCILLNPSDAELPLIPLPGERFLYKQDGVKVQTTHGAGYPGQEGNYSVNEGILLLSPQRIVYIACPIRQPPPASNMPRPSPTVPTESPFLQPSSSPGAASSSNCPSSVQLHSLSIPLHNLLNPALSQPIFAPTAVKATIKPVHQGLIPKDTRIKFCFTKSGAGAFMEEYRKCLAMPGVERLGNVRDDDDDALPRYEEIAPQEIPDFPPEKR